MDILFLSGWFPSPPDNGSKLRIHNMLRGLANQHRIDLITFSEGTADEGHLASLGEMCSSVDVVPWKPYQPASLRAVLGLLNPTPRSIVDTFSQEMERRISSALRRQRYDVVIASELRTAAYCRSFAPIPAIFDDLEVGVFVSKVIQAPSSVHRWRHQMTLVKQQRYLERLLPRFRACTVVSEQEEALVRQRVPAYEPLEIVPNCVRLDDYRDVTAQQDGNMLIFTGSFRYGPNHEAMVWFLDQVFPRIQAHLPDVQITITGDHDNLPLPRARGVNLTGFVDDVRPLIASAAVSVIPLRLGGGTRLKILEAMALGTAVVSTTKGAEGLDVQNGRHLLLADTPSDFAQSVVALVRNRDLQATLAHEARKLIVEQYDWDVVLPRFSNLVERVSQQKSVKDTGP